MISHPRETLFVHIPKTGGQSVEMVFLNDQGLGWKDRGSLLLRSNKDRSVGPEMLAHLYADEYVALRHITPERFARYRKFTIVRHPFDRIVSEYRYRIAAMDRRGGDGAVPSFDDLLDFDFRDDYYDLSRHLVPQTRYILNAQGNCIVNHIVRFETLAQEIPPLFARVFGEDRPLPHRNRTRPGISFSRDDLTTAQKDLLFERYRADFEMFGYAR